MEPDNFTDLIDQYVGLKMSQKEGQYEYEAAKKALNDEVRFIKSEALSAIENLKRIKENIWL